MGTDEHLENTNTGRREFLKTSSKAIARAALTAGIARPGYTAEVNTIRLALIGAGGWGSKGM